MCIVLASAAYAGKMVVVDASTGEPLSGASVFSRSGAVLGACSAKGLMPYISSDNYPVAVRCVGYREATGIGPDDSIVALEEMPVELSEVVVSSKDRRVLHIIAFVRDYSTLTTYSDTVSMFREKWVDYMMPLSNLKNFEGWRTPRVLDTRSYYRFTDSSGLDSVSNRSNHHFSWSDWIGIVDNISLPRQLALSENATDTIYGKYSPTEIWTRRDDALKLTVNVLADTLSRRWVPDISHFFNKEVDFETFNISYDFRNFIDDTLRCRDLARISSIIESRGRGHNMFKFNRRDEPYFVSTYSEFYIVSKEFITRKEAKKRAESMTADVALDIRPPQSIVPDVSPEIAALIERVDTRNYDEERVWMKPDRRLAGKKIEPYTNKEVILKILKDALFH